MSWNNGLEKKKFIARMKKQAEEYRAAGMTEDQIKAMYEFDLGQFKSDRRFYSHTQPLELHEANDEGDELEESFVRDFFDSFSVSDEQGYLEYGSRYAWIEMIDNPELARELQQLSRLDKEILTMTVYEGYKLIDLVSVLNTPYRTLKYHLSSIRVKISKYFS